MDHKKLPISIKKSRRPLWGDILNFSRRKYFLAFLLVLIGLLGFVIPVIPGFLFILFAVALFKPGFMTKIRAKLNDIFRK